MSSFIKNKRMGIRAMSFFYVTHQGEQRGPYSKEQISGMLKAHQLQWNDYLFDEKAFDWVHIMEHELFTQEFNQSFPDPLKQSVSKIDMGKDHLHKRQWFILKENTNYGPFSKIEVIQMLQCKTLFEHDFIWKETIDNWKKISEVSDFSTENIREVHALATPPEHELRKIFFRRKHARAKFDARIIIHDEKKVYTTMCVEIGEGGVSFNLDKAVFPMKQQVHLHFSPGEGMPQFNVVGKIVSQRGDLFGVQFVNLSGVVKSFIAKYAEELKNVA
jgi:PilZ domain/GYF domain 2